MKYEINGWTRKGKKYKADTLAALKQLYGVKNDTDCQDKANEEVERLPIRGIRTNSLCDVAEEEGIPSLC